MPEGPLTMAGGMPLDLCLGDLRKGQRDSLGANVRDILFRGRDYAIYRSDRGVYVHFADDPTVERSQRAAYAKLCVQLCELRYLTSQLRAGGMHRLLGRFAGQDSLFDHNMAQALMLLMESVAQRSAGNAADANAAEQEAKDIARRALDMAVRRNTIDNTIRYVSTCVLFGLVWLALMLVLWLSWRGAGHMREYLLASATGIVGAVFSVIVRAQGLELRPCDDSGMNKLMSLIRVGMGGIAGPALFLLLMTVSANAVGGGVGMPPAASDGFLRMVAVIGLIGGFAERLVPDLVRGAAEGMERRAGSAGQSASPVPAVVPAAGDEAPAGTAVAGLAGG